MEAPKQVLLDLSPSIKTYTDGTFDRLISFPYVPPIPDHPTSPVLTKDVSISPTVSLRLFLPRTTTSQKLPVVLYYHGSGFCVSSAYDLCNTTFLNIFSAEAGALFVSVEYRLAPEHPLPAAYDDSWDALKWVCSHAQAHDQADSQKEPWISDHADFTRLFVAGDSAGGNIAHNMLLRAASDPLPVKVLGAILSNPYFLGSAIPESEKGPFLRYAEKLWLWLLEAPSVAGGIDNPWINPLADGAPSLAGLGCSRILIIVSEKDELTARTKVYAEEVKKSGWEGELEVVEAEGEDHCFHVLDPHTDKAMGIIRKMAAFISR